jgi:squalene-hopene/tetraprenyl-beta-curcumene cyclase
LWFGNQDDSAEDNPIYGTSKVLLAFADLERCQDEAAQAGINYLIQAQNADGGWGGGPGVSYIGSSSTESSSLEESALALEALLQCGGVTLCTPTIMRGLAWLATTIKHGNLERSTPIGFYFAKLWYYERLYPAIFCHAALSVGLRYFDGTEATYSG